MLLEFYHDPLCAWCYVLSPRVRRLAEEFEVLQVVQRGFALAPNADAISQIFGDKVTGKKEILNHWQAANEQDDRQRMRPQLMADRDFDYPWSMPALLACEAARELGGNAGYWDYFDRVQYLHLTACRNIADQQDLAECATEIGLDPVELLRLARADHTLAAVQQDMARARAFGLRGVPALVLEGQLVAQGAIGWQQLVENVTQVVAARQNGAEPDNQEIADD